ncbi:MAG: potassium-transporting ATPase subunit KdpB [Chloroflexi bacterium]|nr:potassium-transporting ATPase subunit KdpB [Chloroflexota bacterium]
MKHNLYCRAIIEAVIKLDPTRQMHNAAMFLVIVSAILTTALFIWMLLGSNNEPPVITGVLAICLWLTVFVVNIAQALASGHSKIRAEALRQTHQEIKVKKLNDPKCKDNYTLLSVAELRCGDTVLVEAGEIIPADGEVMAGAAPVDESILSGRQTSIIRTASNDCNAVTGDTRVLADWLVIKIRAKPGEGILDHIADLVKEANHQGPPHGAFVQLVIIGSLLVFVLAIVIWTLYPGYAFKAGNQNTFLTITFLIALMIALSPTISGGVLSVIDLAGQDRLLQHNFIPLRQQNAIVMAGQVDVLILDKKDVLVPGYRWATAFIPLDKTPGDQVAKMARLASLADETPAGGSIITLAKKQLGPNAELEGKPLEVPVGARAVPYQAKTGLSGIDFNGMEIRKGAPEAMMIYLQRHGHLIPPELNKVVGQITLQGDIPLVLALNGQTIGVIRLHYLVNKYLKERLIRLRQMGIKSIMAVEDTPLAAAALTAEAGIDDFLAPATAKSRLALVQRCHRNGQRVAIAGHKANDAPVLLEADMALAMNNGAHLAHETASIVSLDHKPAGLVDLIEIGRQQRITHRALAAFSLISDVIKYVALIPVIFVAVYPALTSLNFMHLASPAGAILSTVIFNLISIIALVPLAMRGLPYRLISTTQAQRNLLLVFGLGGVMAPFIGIKIIDLVLVGLGLV